MPSPLLITGDQTLLDDLLRLAAAVGVSCDVARDAPEALRSWNAAPVVVVGDDLVDDLAGHRPARRGDVVLVGRDDPDYRAAVALGASDVVALPEAEAWLVDRLADAGDGGGRAALTLGVVGGSGGVGASTLATAIALLAGRSAPSVLVDLDRRGCGLEVLAGVEDVAGVRWSDLAASSGRLGSQALRAALPRRDETAVLSWSAADAPDDVVVRDVLAALQRGHDLVVLDLGRADPFPDALTRCDHVLLVGSCSVTGVSAASRVVRALEQRASRVWFVARRSGGSADPATAAGALGLPLIATLPDQRGLAEQVDLGLGPVARPRGAVTRAAGQVLGRLAVGGGAR